MDLGFEIVGVFPGMGPVPDHKPDPGAVLDPSEHWSQLWDWSHSGTSRTLDFLPSMKDACCVRFQRGVRGVSPNLMPWSRDPLPTSEMGGQTSR